MGCAISLVKYLIFLFNLLFALAGLALLVVGALIQKEIGDYGDYLSGKFSAPPILMIVVGSIVFIIAFFGCCGAIRESHCMVVTYAIFLLTIFIAEAVVVGLAFSYKNDYTDVLLSKLKVDMLNYNGETANSILKAKVDAIQKGLHCCGYDGPIEMKNSINMLPSSCCVDKVDSCSYSGKADVHYTKGCSDALQDFIEKNGNVIGGVVIGIAALELVGVIFALMLASSIKNKERRGH